MAELRPDCDDPVERTAGWARAALDAGLLDLPLPGRGATGDRFDALAELGATDLSLARVAEGHADAVAVLADLEPGPPPPGLWAVWAANPPTDLLRAERSDGGWVLSGTKPWCSGAGSCDRALVTAEAADGYRLFAVDLTRAGAEPVEGSWPAPGMRGSDSRSVRFSAHPAEEVGGPGAYLERPGFWHGAAGVAAVWWGGASEVARPLAAAHARRPLNPHALAHAGAVDAALAGARALLYSAAAGFDADPQDRAGLARLVAGRVRAVVERAAVEVLDRVGRALGAAPLALDGEHARRVGDLTLYLRQSHAERDLEELGRRVLGGDAWPR
jgi:alkylation response protein AidB-like acyl-CoA dehydrogenase